MSHPPPREHQSDHHPRPTRSGSASSHEHGHRHAGGHSHHGTIAAPGTRGIFLAAIFLNLGFVLIEAGFGLSAHSLALLADAGHNFGDVISLGLAGAALYLAQVSPSAQFTYGLRSSTILAALANAMILLVVTGAIAWASLVRLRAPTPIAGVTVISVATIGVILNGFTALLFASRRREDLNMRGAFLHMVADAAISVGVIVSAIVMRFTAWYWLDPLVSMAIALVILLATWDLFRQSLRLAVQAVPSTIDAAAVRKFLCDLEGVGEVHDLHIWAMSTTDTAMTAHLVMPGGHPGDDFLEHVASELAAHYAVGHVTLQVERGIDGRMCARACEALA